MTLNSEHWPEVLENCGKNNDSILTCTNVNTNLNILNGIDSDVDDYAFSEGQLLPNGLSNSDYFYTKLNFDIRNQEALFGLENKMSSFLTLKIREFGL